MDEQKPERQTWMALMPRLARIQIKRWWVSGARVCFAWFLGVPEDAVVLVLPDGTQAGAMRIPRFQQAWRDAGRHPCPDYRVRGRNKVDP